MSASPTGSPTSNPTKAPTKTSSPTGSPTANPTKAPGPKVCTLDDAELAHVGNDGYPMEEFPLCKCEGDCDADWECDVRDYYYYYVPYCSLITLL